MLSRPVLQISLQVESFALDLPQVKLFLFALGEPLLFALFDVEVGGDFANGTSRPIKSA